MLFLSPSTDKVFVIRFAYEMNQRVSNTFLFSTLKKICLLSITEIQPHFPSRRITERHPSFFVASQYSRPFQKLGLTFSPETAGRSFMKNESVGIVERVSP